MGQPNAVSPPRDAYHALLQGDALASTIASLETAAQDPGLSSAGPDVTRILRPCFITAAQYAAAQRDAAAVVAALEAIYVAAQGDEALRRALGFDSTTDKLLGLEGARPPAIAGRLDGFLQTAGHIQFLEYNPSPGGTYESFALGRLFAGGPIMQEFSRQYPISCPDPLEGAYEALLAAQQGQRLPRIAVFGLADVPQAGEITQLAAVLGRRGLEVRAVGPAGPWELAAGRLRVGEFEVDLLLFLDPFQIVGFLRDYGTGHPVAAALRQGHAHFFGGLFRTLFLSSKRVFAALSDPDYRQLVPAAAQEAVERCVPWTRVVREGRTAYDGQPVELAPFVRHHRERLVLKPPLGYGGSGVVLGWRVSEAHWLQAVAVALRNAWVVQERVQATTDAYPVWRDGRLVFEDLWWDLNPYVWGGGRVGGCLVRVGADPLLNTSAGLGSSTALFVLGR